MIVIRIIAIRNELEQPVFGGRITGYLKITETSPWQKYRSQDPTMGAIPLTPGPLHLKLVGPNVFQRDRTDEAGI